MPLQPTPSPRDPQRRIDGRIVRRALVVRLGALGDVVRTLPAVARLRRWLPEAHIAWLVEERTRPLVEPRGIVDEVLVFPRAALTGAWRAREPRAALGLWRGFLRTLRAQRFDLALDFHGIARSALLVRASGAPLRAGFAAPHAREGAALAVGLHARLPERPVSRFERNDRLVDRLGVPREPERDGAYRLDVDPRALAKLRAALGGGPAPLVLHPGSSAAAAHKRWTPEGFVALAQMLAREDGVPVRVAAGPDPQEQSLARWIVSHSGGAAALAPATPGFEDLAALLACARAFVGADSAPLHVASLVGTPVVQILGPTDPVHNEPWPATPWARARIALACAPCRRGCAAAACMRGVEAARVRAAVHALGVVEGPPRSAGWRRPVRLPDAAPSAGLAGALRGAPGAPRAGAGPGAA